MIDIENMLLEIYEQDNECYFDDPSLGRMFDKPIVGIADAQDPWFDRFKEIIGDFYWTPQEALSLVAPEAEAKSVISWCFPISKVARKANAQEKEFPARLWAYVRTYGEKFITRTRHGMENKLQSMGYAALAPAVSSENKIHNLAACWSERHTAMVAGLGTFGISGGLITSQGIAHRLGSVVTNAPIPATPRLYGDDPFAWCLRSARDICGACIRRCPADSIGETVHERNKEACRSRLSDVTQQRRESFGWKGSYGCGLCQTSVPCEDRNPTA